MVPEDHRVNKTKLPEEIHWEIQDWKMQFHTMDNDFIMLEEVLNSDVYRSNTRNLFERLQDYKSRLQAFKTVKDELRKIVSRHESQVGAADIYACKELESGFYLEHDILKIRVENTLVQFQLIKMEISNYTDGLPKRPGEQVSS